LLCEEGYETLETATGKETLDVLLLSPAPLIVLLDLVMPDMTGYDVLTSIATHEVLATRHRYIALSAASPFRIAEQIGPHFAELLQRLNATFIEKPFDIDTLLRSVRAHSAALIAGEAPPESSGKQTA
jgi:CheY-like chemotaxis protein